MSGAGKPYRPANGSERVSFTDAWCHTCVRDRAFRQTEEDGCPILAAALCFRPDEPGYPEALTHDENEQPVCSAYLPDEEVAEPPPLRDREREAAGQLTL